MTLRKKNCDRNIKSKQYLCIMLRDNKFQEQEYSREFERDNVTNGQVGANTYMFKRKVRKEKIDIADVMVIVPGQCDHLIIVIFRVLPDADILATHVGNELT